MIECPAASEQRKLLIPCLGVPKITLRHRSFFYGSLVAMKKIPEKYRVWIDARKRYHLSHKHIQMARELGLNPKKFGGLANHRQEPWKSPLPDFIEKIYWKRFRKTQPDCIERIQRKSKLLQAKCYFAGGARCLKF